MKVTVVREASGQRRQRFLVALPAAFGALLIALVKLGVVATAVIILVTIPVFTGCIRVLSGWYRRRLERRYAEPGLVLCGEASINKVAGVFRVSAGSIEWRSRRGSVEPVALSLSEVTSAVLVPIGALFIRATRLSLTTSDGSRFEMTLTVRATKCRRRSRRRFDAHRSDMDLARDTRSVPERAHRTRSRRDLGVT